MDNELMRPIGERYINNFCERLDLPAAKIDWMRAEIEKAAKKAEALLVDDIKMVVHVQTNEVSDELSSMTFTFGDWFGYYENIKK